MSNTAAAALHCPKCSSDMQEGFIPDAISTISYKPVVWVSDKRETSPWTGVRMTGKQQKLIKAFRCTGCGYLEMYAP